MNELLEIRNLSKYYSRRTAAVSDMNLIIPRGRIIGLLGPNGSGKTTLIKMINGLLTPTTGEILIDGLAPGFETRQQVAYLPEQTYLDSGMNVDELVEFFADFYDNFVREKADQMLAALNIDPKAKLKTLSKGTREKVQLILVMSREADLYILDEPIAGVDPAARDYILKTIITNYNENATLLLSTHLISDIENILDDVVFIRDGKVLLQSTVEDIRETRKKSVDAYFREVFAC